VPHADGTVESFRFGLAAENGRYHRSANDKRRRGAMQARIDVARVSPDAYKAMLGMQGSVNASGLE
jgi:hypothetical protein